MNDKDQKHSDFLYEQHINALTLQGKSERTIEMYSRSLRKITAKFDMPPDRITTEHLKQYFLELAQSHSWSSVKIDRNAFQFFFKFVLNKQWQWFEIVAYRDIGKGRELGAETLSSPKYNRFNLF